MIELPDSPLLLGVMPMLAWEQAKDRYRSGGAPDEDQAVFQQAAGLYLEDGSLEPRWAEALGVAVTAKAGFVLVATMGDVVFLSTAHLAPDRTVVARSRAVSENGQLTKMEPVVEIALAPADQTWDALARVLPPALTAAPRVGERRPVARPDVTPPAGVGSTMESIAAWDGAPEELRRSAEAALSPDATLTLTWGGPGVEGPNTLMWFCRGEEIYRVDREHWDAVEPGDLAAELVALAADLRG